MGSIPSQTIVYNAPPIPSPKQLSVNFEDNKYVLYWQTRQVLDKSLSYHYEVLINEGKNHVDESTAQVIKVDQPPFLFNEPKLDTIYSFSVRLVTDEGFKSPISETYSTQRSSGECFIFIFRFLVNFIK